MNSTVSYYTQMNPVLVKISQEMNFWLTIFFLIPGCLLNILMASIFMKKRFWKNSSNMGYYYTVHPLLCNLYLVNGILNFLTTYYGLDLALMTIGGCFIMYFFRLLLLIGAQYVQVQMTLDRAVNILYPRRFIWLQKPTNLAKITCAIYVVFAVYSASLQAFRRFTYGAVTRNGTITYVPVACGLSGASSIANSVSFFCVRSFGIIITMIANVFIIKKLVESKKNSNQRGSSAGMSSKEFSFAFSLIWANFLLLFCSIPFVVILLIQLTYAFNPSPPADMVKYYNLLYGIVVWGNYIYDSLHFWINLATNKVFKQEVRRLLRMSPGATVSTFATTSQANARAISQY